MTTDKTNQGMQIVLPGTERSARQAAAAREQRNHGKMRSAKPQREPGGMFAIEKPEPSLL